MKTLILFFSGVLMLSGLNTCTKNIANTADKPLEDTEWDLQSFEVIGAGETDRGSETIFLIFKEDSTFKGRSSNNSYGGSYKIEAECSIFMSVPVTTKVNSPPGSKYWEYLGALHNSSSYEIEGNRLRIFYDGKMKALNFKAK